MDDDYISLYQAMRCLLPFVSMMNERGFLLKLQRDTSKIMRSILENPARVNKDNQGEIAIAIDLQIRPCTKHNTIRYNHLNIISTKGGIVTEHTKRKIFGYFYKYL